jgi:hypothetical protein
MNIQTSNIAYPAFVLAAAAFVVVSTASAGDIDFEGLAEGTVIDEVSNGNGANGLPNGHVDVFGFNPKFGFADNAAIVFDSSCPPGGVAADCSGNDKDLGSPNTTCPGGGPGVGAGGACPGTFQNDTALGKIAIIAKDLTDSEPDGLVDDPNDDDQRGQYIDFDFKPLAGKDVTVNSITYIDNDEGEFDAQLEFFGPGTLNPSTIGITAVGNNGVNTITPGISGVKRMRVVLNGSGGLDNIVINEEVRRACWVTLGGFDKGEVAREDASGKKICTFGGNVGPPPSGALEVNWHDGPLAGSQFHTNAITAVRCEDLGTSGPQQPGGKKGLVEDTLFFDCTGLFDHEEGFTCSGFFQDGGEPAGKKGNDPDRIQVVVFDGSSTEVARCEGLLSGGNIQIHPPVGKP